MCQKGSTYVAIDFETANQSRDSACAIGVAVIEDGAVRESFQRLIRPPTDDFSDWNFRIHGIHWKDVEHEDDFVTVWGDLQQSIGDAVYYVAHNAGFEQQVLAACCDYYDIAPPDTEFLCTIEAASMLWPLESYKLPRVCQFLGIPLKHHNAQSDAEASANILLKAMIQGYSPECAASEGTGLWAAKHLSNEIMQLVSSIVEDGVVEADDIHAAATWMERNPEAVSVWPGSELMRRLEAILEDGIIASTELDEFHSLCNALLGLNERKKARRSITKRPGAMSVCFTGFGPGKVAVRAQAEAAGYHVVATVTKRLDYLVCGPVQGPSKIEQAIDRGAKVVTCEEWQAILNMRG